MQILNLNHKLDEKWFENIEELQEEILSMQPCIVFMALTYPAGNTGYFLASAVESKYTSVSIGKSMYETVLGAMIA